MKLSSHEWVMILFAVVGAATALSSLFLLLHLQKMRSRYNDDLRRAELEVVRRGLESQLYEVNARLAASEDRWKDVNHLLLSAQREMSDVEATHSALSVPRLDFLIRAGLKETDFEINRRLVFTMIPFHPRYDHLFDHIRETCMSLGFECMRGDEEHVRGDLLTHVLKLIVKARLVIAVVDGRNPNVFYELGIAHALSRPVLILGREPKDVPFDVSSNRIIFYDSDETLSVSLARELTKLLIATTG